MCLFTSLELVEGWLIECAPSNRFSENCWRGGGGFLGVVIDKVFVGVESMFWLSVAAACE